MRLSHAPTIGRSAQATLTAVFDVDAGRAEALARDFGVPRHTTDLRALVEGTDVDAVIVATPNRQSSRGRARGGRGRQARALREAAGDRRRERAPHGRGLRAGGRACCRSASTSASGRRCEIAKALIDSGFIGKVHGFRSVYSERWDAYPAATRYRYDLARSGGATIIDLTIHRIDLARHLLGDFAAVCAELAHSVVPDAVDDNVWLLARFASGARGCLSSDRYSPAIGDGTDIYGIGGHDPHRDRDA